MAHNKFLISGASGQLGREFQKILSKKNIDFIAPSKKEWDITDYNRTEGIIKETNPSIIINCAAYNFVDEAEQKTELAYLINTEAVENLAKACRENKIFLVHYSSDYVFDGSKEDLYIEEDKPFPLNVYGRSKLEGEKAGQNILSDYLIFRLSWVIGEGSHNFLYKLKNWSRKKKAVKISSDEVSVPTFTEDIVNITLLSLKKGLRGLFHLTNSGYASRYELAKYFLSRINASNIIIPVCAASFKTKAKRPYFSAMSNSKLSKELNIAIPDWEDAVDRYINLWLMAHS